MTRKYRRLRLIGSGGMGDVYEGRIEFELGREMPCAIKLIRKDLSDDPNMQELFGREAMTTLALSCPYLVRAHDFGRASDGRLFLVLRLIHGPDLRVASKMIDGDPRILRRIARDVLRGMVYLHDNDIIHSDISPSNIMIDREGHAVLSDLGIVKRANQADPHEHCGAAPYVAPELRYGGHASVMSDAYSLGATLYELITGAPPRPPHGDEHDPTDHADAPDLPDSVPADLAAFVRGLLCRKPIQRLTVAVALAQLDSDPDLLADDAELTEFANTWLDATAEERAAAPEVTPLSLLGAALQLQEKRESGQSEQSHEPTPSPRAQYAPRKRRRWFVLGVISVAAVLAAALIAILPALWQWSRSGESEREALTERTDHDAGVPADEQQSNLPGPAELSAPPEPPESTTEPEPTIADDVSPPDSTRRGEDTPRARRTARRPARRASPVIRERPAPLFQPVVLE